MQIQRIGVDVYGIEYPIKEISYKYKHIFEKLSDDVKNGKYDIYKYEKFLEESEEEK